MCYLVSKFQLFPLYRTIKQRVPPDILVYKMIPKTTLNSIGSKIHHIDVISVIESHFAL